MESIKKAALLIFLIGAVSVVSSTKVNALGSQEWNNASISTAMVTGSAVLISSSGARYLVDGVILSTTVISSSGWVTLRDTSVANTSLFTGGGTGATLTVFVSTAGNNSISGPKLVNFVPPIRFYFGISADASGCGTLGTYCYTVLYRRISDD